MSHRTRHATAVIILGLTLGFVLGVIGASKASAVEIEKASRSVAHLEITYVEPMPTAVFPTRTYFELNDGSAWGFVRYDRCRRDNRVPNRICKTVFWYAR